MRSAAGGGGGGRGRRRRSHLVVVAGKEVPPQVGPLALGIGVGGDHHLFRQYRPRGAAHRPQRALPLQGEHRRALVQLPATLYDGSGQSARIGHGIESAGASVEQRRADSPGAAGLVASRAGQQLQRSAAARPLRVTALQIGHAAGVVRHVQGALAAQLAIDAEAFDGLHHQRRRPPQHGVELFSLLGAEGGDHLVRGNPGAGVDQSDITSRPAVADLVRFQHAHRTAGLQQVERRRKPGETGADHTYVGALLAVQARRSGQARRNHFPQTPLLQTAHARLRCQPHCHAAGARRAPFNRR